MKNIHANPGVKAAAAAGLLLLLMGACSGSDKPPSNSETGFMAIEPVTYELFDSGAFKTMVTDEARIWYVYEPAAVDPDKKPLAVFFNGGPGCATLILLGFNTQRLSADRDHNGGGVIGPSPADWGGIANLLYIDARNTGFSYSLGSSADAFNNRNFNPYIDAGDFIRVILRFLAAHKNLQKNPVIMVGESYGGTRASVMLNTILNYKRLGGGGKIYHDAGLMAEIQSHLEAVSGASPGTVFTPEAIAGQFGRQVLIQPYMLGSRQFDKSGELMEKEGSPPYIVASDTGQTFVPCSKQQNPDCNPQDNALGFINGAGRDVYIYPERRNWLGDREQWPLAVFLSVEDHTEYMGRDPREVVDMYAITRKGAYKKKAPGQGSAGAAGLSPFLKSTMKYLKPLDSTSDPEAEFIETFGPLRSDDQYYMGCSNDVMGAFAAEGQEHSEDSPNIGRAFLENLLYVKTFITKAALDTVVYSPAIPEALKVYEEVSSVAEAGGLLTITIKDGAFPGVKPGGETKMVPFPAYPESGHPVTTREPVKFYQDVKNWILEPLAKQ
jgi:carboxypeptidase C (cathepsin A)